MINDQQRILELATTERWLVADSDCIGFLSISTFLCRIGVYQLLSKKKVLDCNAGDCNSQPYRGEVFLSVRRWHTIL